MKTFLKFALSVLIVLSTFLSAVAQDGPCVPDTMQSTINRLLQTYQENQSAPTSIDSLSIAWETVQGNINELITSCQSSQDTQTALTEPGNGTLNSPFAFAQWADTGYGFNLRISGATRPGDQIIRTENRFNDRPEIGQEYIIIYIDIECTQSSSERCETNYLDYELVGNSGTIYSHASVVFEDKINLSLFGGGSGSGGLVFLISEDESNLRLLYRPNMFQDEIVVFHAQPAPGNGIEITSSSSLNVRQGAGTTFAVAGSLPANTTVIAFGRNQDGTWLQIAEGWVFAELITTEGDIQSLPVLSQ